MKTIIFWTVIGLGLAIVCGLARLPHLSASLVTLTVFFTVPALLIVALDAPRKASLQTR